VKVYKLRKSFSPIADKIKKYALKQMKSALWGLAYPEKLFFSSFNKL
jgi:hypothetical protein